MRRDGGRESADRGEHDPDGGGPDPLTPNEEKLLLTLLLVVFLFVLYTTQH